MKRRLIFCGLLVAFAAFALGLYRLFELRYETGDAVIYRKHCVVLVLDAWLPFLGTLTVFALFLYRLIQLAFLPGWARRQLSDPVSHERWDAQLLRLPLVGGLIRKIEAGRFTRTLGTLLRNGVSLPAAIDIAKEIIGNRVIGRALAQVALRVRQGEPLSRALTEAAVLPPLTTQLLKVGEETGHLERMLEQSRTSTSARYAPTSRAP